MQPAPSTKLLETVSGVEIGVIGGSGLYNLEHLEVLGEYKFN
jgi:purine nucleoside phosphorylase